MPGPGVPFRLRRTQASAAAVTIGVCAFLLLFPGISGDGPSASVPSLDGDSHSEARPLNATTPTNSSIGVEGTFVVYDAENGNLYISSNLNSTILVVNATTRQLVVAPIPVGPYPGSSAIDTWNNCLYVVTAGDPPWSGVTVVNLTTNRVLPTNLLVGTNTLAIAFDPRNGFLYVANELTNNISVINGTTNRLTGLPITMYDPGALVFDPWTGDLYVGGGGYSDQGGGVVNTRTNLPYANVSGPDGMAGLAYDPQNHDLYGDFDSGQVIGVVNGLSRNLSETIPDRGTGPFAVTVEGDSGRVVFGPQVFDTATDTFPYPFLPSTLVGAAYDPSNGWLFGVSPEYERDEGSIVGVHDTGLVSVQFVETGLAQGTLWTVELGVSYWDQSAGADYITPVGNHSYNQTIEMAVWNGTYAYTVTAASASYPALAGEVDVNGPGSSASVVFGPYLPHASTHPPVQFPPVADVALVVALAGVAIGVVALVLLLRLRPPPRNREITRSSQIP